MVLHRHFFYFARPNKTVFDMEGEDGVFDDYDGGDYTVTVRPELHEDPVVEHYDDRNSDDRSDNADSVRPEFHESRPFVSLGIEREERLRNHVVRRYKCFKFLTNSQEIDRHFPFLERSNELAKAFRAIGMDKQTPSGALEGARCYKLVGSKIEGHLRSIRANKVKSWRNYVANGGSFVWPVCFVCLVVPAFHSFCLTVLMSPKLRCSRGQVSRCLAKLMWQLVSNSTLT